MIQPPLLVLTFEGLSPAAVGCFGSSWNRTPVIDSIAGTGCAWDRCLATSDNPDRVFHQLVERLLDGRPKSSDTIELQTDVPAVIDGTSDRLFDRIDLVASDPVTEQEKPQTDVIETQLGRLFASVIARSSQSPNWNVLWVHSGFLTRRWDAPRDDGSIDIHDIQDEPRDPASTDPTSFETADETDAVESPPQIFDSVIPPSIELKGDEHPDLVTSWMRTYGCQVHMLDVLLDVLIRSLEGSQSQTVIAGTSGFRLGQAGWIGHGVGPLRSRDVHVPVVCSGSGPVRCSRLTSLDSVADCIAGGLTDSGWLDQWSSERDDRPIEVNSIRSMKNLTTPDWFYVCDDDSSQHLFSKPDDIDDFNDVATVRPDVVSELDCDER